jgi:hypothetical protein
MRSDNALQNFVPKLKDHLSRRIQRSRDASSSGEYATDTIILKDDRMYRHNVARFNYTTYDVRRAQDVLNPRTSHCNIMVLGANNGTEYTGHSKVLGIYHVNVIHVGSGMTNYTPQRMEFLWVRWYQPVTQVSAWESSTLDRVKFPPLNDEHSFDFVDPEDVLRGCHIIPRFAKREKHPDGLGVSACAQDKNDWLEYYVNR